MTNERRLRLYSAGGTAFFVFVIYMITLAPSMDFIDAGELAAVVHSFGIAHPTGYPLFTILGGLWAKLPIGDGIYRMNVFSALCGAAGAAILVDTIRLLLALPYRRGVRKSRTKKAPKSTDEVTLTIAAVLGVLLIALSKTWWRTSLSIEVYSLHMLLLALVLWSAARVLQASMSTKDDVALSRRVIVLAAMLGLSFCNHMSTVFTLPALAVLMIALLIEKRVTAKTLVLAAGAGALMLLPYIYLPLRAATDPVLNWGNPDTLQRLVWHVTGKQYSVWMFSSVEAWQDQFANITAMLPRDVAYFALLPALVGVATVFLRNARLGWLLLLLFLTCLIWSAGYDIHDIDSYLLLCLVVMGIWAAFGMESIGRWLKQRGMVQSRYPVAIGAVFVFPVLLNFGSVSQRGNHLVEDYTKNMFAGFEENALVLSYQWDYWVSAALYYQEVEGFRKDVIVLDKELFRRSWYIEQLRVNFPEIHETSLPEIERFSEQLYKFEHDLPYDAMQIEQAFNDLINSFLDKNYHERPLYLTIEMEDQFGPEYVRVPVGLAFRLYREEDLPPARDLAFPDIVYRPFQSDERLVQGLHGMYATMFSNSALYMHRAGEYELAVPHIERALEFAPGDARLMELRRLNEQARVAAPLPSEEHEAVEN